MLWCAHTDAYQDTYVISRTGTWSERLRRPRCPCHARVLRGVPAPGHLASRKYVIKSENMMQNLNLETRFWGFTLIALLVNRHLPALQVCYVDMMCS